MQRRARSLVSEADIVFRDLIGDRHQAGVRCPRCARVLAVEWKAEEEFDAGTKRSSRSLGRCEGCYRPWRSRAGGRQVSESRGYVHVVLESDGSLTTGTWAGDAVARLTVLVTGVASCGCCHVTLVRCGGCGIPIATVHKAPETHVVDEKCGYCPRCDRLVSIKAADPAHPGALRFSDRVASPEEIDVNRRYEWRDHTREEMHDVDGWTTMQRVIPRELLDLVELPSDAVEFIGRDGRLTWEAWLDELGGSDDREHGSEGSAEE